MHLEILARQFDGNSLGEYILAATYFAAIVGASLFVRRLIEKRGSGLAADMAKQVRLLEILVVALDAAVRSLELTHSAARALHVVTVLVIAWRLVGLLSALTGFAIRRTILTESMDPANLDTAQAATLGARALIWGAAALFVLSNLGFNVSSVLAGLGIGGVAVALAAQAVLGDLFAAIAIYLDKPFIAGDNIQVGDMSGTVEHIGVKTTRVRSSNGELLVYPNSSLASARIQNFRALKERRAVVAFTVPFHLTTAVLRRIPDQAREIVSAQPDVRFERAHLAAITENGLQFELVFHVQDARYGAFMDRRQSVLLALLDALQTDGIPFAVPTVTLKQ